MTERVAAGDEPWIAGWDRLTANPHSAAGARTKSRRNGQAWSGRGFASVIEKEDAPGSSPMPEEIPWSLRAASDVVRGTELLGILRG
jgi:hypothetical protein